MSRKRIYSLREFHRLKHGINKVSNAPTPANAPGVKVLRAGELHIVGNQNNFITGALYISGSLTATEGITMDGLKTRAMSEASHYVGIGTTGTSITHRLTLPTGSPGPDGSALANSWIAYSSKRYKENITPIENPLEKLQNLHGLFYEWRGTGKRELGFLAEDVGKVLPEVVAWEENGVDAVGMHYSRLTALLVESIKEQQKQIHLLSEEIADLKKVIKSS